MSYQQLVTPNTNIPYVGGFCEGFVEGTVGQATLPTLTHQTMSGVYSTASNAWANLPGKHPGEQPPSGVTVPVYFSLGSTPAGHVAISLPDGRVASSTQSGFHTTAYIHPSLTDLINTYAKYNNGCTYLGWSEYIGKLQVVKEGDMPLTDAQVDKVLKMGLRREPTAAELQNPEFHDAGLLIDTVWNNGGEQSFKSIGTVTTQSIPDEVQINGVTYVKK